MKNLALAILAFLALFAAPAAFAQTGLNGNEITIIVPNSPPAATPAGPTPAVEPVAGATAEPTTPPPKPEPKPKPKPEPKTETRELKADTIAGADWERNLHANIKLNWWAANYEGNLKFAQEEEVGGASIKVGDNIDLVDEFDIQNPMSIYEFEAWAALGEKNRLLLSYFGAVYSGENNISETLEFAGVSFEANSDVETTVSMSRIGLLADFLPLSGDAGNLGLRYGIEYFIWQIDLKGTESVTNEKIDESQYLPVPIPVIGLTGNLYLPYGFGVYGSFVGIGGDFGDIDASYTDLDVGISWSWKYLYTGVGFRSLHTILNYETDSDEVHLDVTQSGMLCSVGLAL